MKEEIIPLKMASDKFVELQFPPYVGMKGFLERVYIYDSWCSGVFHPFSKRNYSYKYINTALVNKNCRVLSHKETEKESDTEKIIEYTSTSINYTIGTDPEIFVVDDKGIIIPAFLFLKPKRLDKRVFWDGFQAEFTTHGGESCLEYLTDMVHDGLTSVIHAAKKFNPKAMLTWKSVLDIPKSMMKAASPEHAALGCAPSLNAYSGEKPLRVNARKIPFRFAGCHYHFGLDKVYRENIPQAVKMIDAILGIASISLFQGMEDPRRRLYYGRAGEYRLPKHGLEYRVMSSAVLSHPAIFHLCYDMGRAGLGMGARLPVSSIMSIKEDSIRSIINEYNIPKAKKVIKIYKDIYAALLSRLYGKSKAEQVFHLILDGVNHRLDLSSIEKSWRIRDMNAHYTEEYTCSTQDNGTVRRLHLKPSRIRK